MGGTLGVTIRDLDGTVHRMGRWTNPTPYFIHNLHFIEKDRAYLQAYLDEWYKMRSDWLQFGNTPQNPSPMSACYADDANMVLAPQGYGLLVIDYQTGVVLHCQGYTSYGGGFYYGRCHDEREVKAEIENNAYLIDLFNAGRIKNLAIEDRFYNPITDYDFVSGSDFVCQVCGKWLYAEFDIDVSPWTVTRFKMEREAWLVFRQTCDNLIGLTAQDKAAWDEWLVEF